MSKILTALWLIITVPVIIALIARLLYFLYLWQVKEYRLDRITAHFYDNAANSVVERGMIVVKLLALLVCLVFATVNPNNLLLLAGLLAYVIYVVEAESAISKLIHGKLRRPAIKSLRNALMASVLLPLLMLAFAGGYIWALQLDIAPKQLLEEQNNGQQSESLLVYRDSETQKRVIPWPTAFAMIQIICLLLADLAIAPGVALMVALTSPLSTFARSQIIARAKAKFAKLNKLRVIGITGSYGKSTTKELLAQLLSSKFKLVKTPKNLNTAVGVAQTLLADVNENTEIFVAEMGAYTEHEIADSAEIAKPDVGIITAVDRQHLQLFGGFENLFQAKFEMASSTKKDGVVILNGDNEHTLRMANMIDTKKIIYTLNDVEIDKYPNAQLLRCNELVITEEYSTMKIWYNAETADVKTNLTAKHNISNLLAVIAASLAVGLTLQEVAELITNTQFDLLYFKTTNRQGVTIVDDGYNSNPTGFIAAIHKISELKLGERKIVFTQGILELGLSRDREYANICDELLEHGFDLITSDRALHNIARLAGLQSIYTKDSYDFARTYRQHIKKGDCVLIEGSMPANFISYLGI